MLSVRLSMPFERTLFALLLLVSIAAFTGLGERLWPSGPRMRDGVLVLPRLDAGRAPAELALANGERVRVRAPVGARRQRPLAILLLAARGTPSLGCAELEKVLAESAFVLCLPVSQELDATALRLRQALEQLKRSFGDYVAPGSVALVGTDDAADQAIALARQAPSFFSRLVLVEGGSELWSASSAAIFARGGGLRVLFLCRSLRCASQAQAEIVPTRSVGVDAALEVVPEHRDLIELARRRVEWLVRDDSRFRDAR